MTIKYLKFLSVFLITGCGSMSDLGKPPAFSDPVGTAGYTAMTTPRVVTDSDASKDPASLWHSGPTSLLGDRRAGTLGDLVTVVIEINDKAEISNSTAQSRKGAESVGAPALLGLPQAIDQNLPDGASMADAVDLSSSSSASGNGSVRRNEKLTLRIAATVTAVMPNGHLKIEGIQEVRVNNELRELLVAGYVRPEDVSRRNEITYDKIASAKISYGGRGQITRVQQPRIGQQVLDMILPF
ncbi:MAG: flagellar basal body L-ring protein FlgH [Rhodobacteraceae bacterium]|nr:flagellar basal body L-ring protein FlgH [Paracoccaceae bacterium]